jgi:serine/threonine protein kinase
VVKEATHKSSGRKVAIKSIKKKNMKEREIQLQRNEIEVLKMCQHPNIVTMLDVFENPDYFYIVLEYLSGGDMFDYLKRREFEISEDRARQMIHQIANAIYYMHSFGIVHRDIKLENIMMTDDSNTAEPKIVDFGLAKMVGPEEVITELFGTLGYVAPEIL